MHSQKDKALKTLELVFDALDKELGRKATTAEVMTRLALMTGVFIGGAAQDTSDPEGFIFRAIQPINSTAKATFYQLAR
jgi:hypothetical protein